MKKIYYATTQGEKQRARVKRLHERNYAIIRAAKEKPCTDCGNTYPWWMMDLDHLRDKKFMVSWSGCRSLAKVEAEIAKREPVCSNCHRNRTYQRKHAPVG
jgi:hypothetical protein